MSHKQNTEWIEAAWENFEGACSEGNVGLAKAVIADTFDAGFADDGRKMNTRLREVTAGQVSNQVE